MATTGSSTNPYMFAATSGYRNDGDAGLMHVGARYYDAQVGRFISRDTVLSQKPYLYCEHDPVNAVDPSGHKLVDWEYLAGGAGLLVGSGAMVGGGVGGVLLGGYMVGDWIGDRLYGGDQDFLPAPTPGDMEEYREQIIRGRLRGDIPMPPGGSWRSQPPVIRSH